MDLMTTGLLIYYLHRKDSGVRRYVVHCNLLLENLLTFSRTKYIIHTLMFYTVNTGAMTMYVLA